MASKTYYPPFIPAFSSNGAPVPGARLNFYYTGTDTRAPIYSDAGLTVEHENPVVADASGKFPPIYLNDAVTYRVVQTDRNGAAIGDAIDPYIPGTALKGQDALPPVTVEIATVDGVLTYPQAGDFSDINSDFKYDNNLFVRLNGVVLDKDEDYTAPGEYAPITLTENPGVGKLVLTTYAVESRGTGIERLYLVHTYREDGDTNDSQAVLRTRDAIEAAGGGTMYFVRGEGSRTDGDYAFGSDTQNNDPTNEGNLCSNLIVRSDPGVTLWLDRADGPFLFFHNPAGNTGAAQVEPVTDNVQFRGLVTRDDPTITGPGFEGNSAFYHIAAMSNVLWERCAMIGGRGDGIYIGAGDLGPDGNGERQNRLNRNVVVRDCFWDGINTNNRNAISLLSIDKFRLEGVNASYNWGKAGGIAAEDPYDPATGVGAPAGGIDIEPNSFTAQPLVRDISGSFWTTNSGAAGLAILLFGQDDLNDKFEGIDLKIYADNCRLGALAFFNDENQLDSPRIKVSGIARNCTVPFELLRGTGLDFDIECYDCPNPATLSYTGGWRLKNVSIKGYFERCGVGGAIVRLIGGSGLDFDMTFRNALGVPLQLTHDSAVNPATPGENYETVLSDSRISLKLDEGSASFPQQRIAVDISSGLPRIDAGTVLDAAGQVWRDGTGATIPDSIYWQANGMLSRSVPTLYSWKRNNIVYAHPDVEEGGPFSWITITENDYYATPRQYPDFRVHQYKGVRPTDPTITPVPVTRTAKLAQDTNGRLTALAGNQFAYATSALSTGSGHGALEWIYTVPYSGSVGVYAGVTSDATPTYDAAIDPPTTRHADIQAALWFDGETQKLRTLANSDLAGEYDPVPLGSQVRILAEWNGSKTQVTFGKRAGTSGSWTALGGAIELTVQPANLRAFVVLAAASETIQLVKQGTV